ncbi:MAG TPA: hypothetical protein VM428_01630, partial [Microlunatus sp.]|nr:hypothetical protein [Microlunatus sp.]
MTGDGTIDETAESVGSSLSEPEGDSEETPEPGTRAAEVLTEPLIGPDPQAAAFFDLDNTMIQGASLFYLAKGLYQRDFFPTRL